MNARPGLWGAVVMVSGMLFTGCAHVEVKFVKPEGMTIGWQEGWWWQDEWGDAQVVIPGRAVFEQGESYRLKLDSIPEYSGPPLYPSLHIYDIEDASERYVDHTAVPVEFSDEDFRQVRAGNFVTKVVYLPDPEHQALAISGVETLVSTRLEPGQDAIEEADKKGTILLVIEMGDRNLEPDQGAPEAEAEAGTGVEAEAEMELAPIRPEKKGLFRGLFKKKKKDQ